METYTALKGKIPVDWNALINKGIALKDSGCYDLENKFLDEIYDLSGDWRTCPTGNQSSLIDRDINGIPVDPELKGYGLAFFEYVNNSLFIESLEILFYIETRSSELIKKFQPRS